MKKKDIRYIRRKKRVSSKMFGTKQCPRLSVFRSNVHVYAQIIDDEGGKTLASSSDLKIKKAAKMTNVQIAESVGEDVAKKALSAKINTVVFDRNGFRYHGRVKALADGARKGGLKF